MPQNKIIPVLLVLVTLLLPDSLFPQERRDRQAYAAGRFYTADSASLVSELELLFESAETMTESNVRAIISPHAGYAYSGEMAATAFKQIAPSNSYDNIFIIGSSHSMAINGASIYSVGDYVTPLGKVIVNTQLANELIASNKHINYVPGAHTNEHIIENQLPFLQYLLEEDCRIVPLSVGTNDKKILQSIASSLKPFFNEHNLFVISADFSHYPNYADACKVDSLTAKAIMSKEVDYFTETVNENLRLGMKGLTTCTCGISAITTLLYLNEGQEELSFIPLKYMNSGDVEIGDKNRVVGYFALALVENDLSDQAEFLTKKDKEDLLNIARLTIDEYINKGIITKLDPNQFSENILHEAGVFVTLNKNNNLRGCIGQFNPTDALYLSVQEMAIAAATQDYRFQTVRPAELDLLDIEISVLTPLKKINSVDEIELGRDGIYIIKDNKSGTYLPKVAIDTGWDIEEFLGHCSRDKAGIGWDGWKDADIYIYQAVVFSESEMRDEH